MYEQKNCIYIHRKILQTKMWQYEYKDDICPLQNNKRIKEICTNIDRLIKNSYKEKIKDFFTSLNNHKKKTRMHTNQYILHRHF